jgi:putative FmdB family regulatory protein
MEALTMPLYDYKCPTCQRRWERMLKLADLETPQSCGACGQPMVRLLAAPFVRGDYAAYDCPITGKRIEGRRAHEENLARHGCRLYEPGETQDYLKRKAQSEASFDAVIEATADELIYRLPSEKKEQLANEMAAGVTADIVRTSPT